MMYRGPQAFLKAVAELGKLPGVGEKTAQRLVFHLVNRDSASVDELARALRELKLKITLCSVCCGLTDDNPCEICRDPRRDSTQICVVEDPSDLMAIERSAQFRGRYHVLHGSLSPLEGIGPGELKISGLKERLDEKGVTEVILATNPDVEGEATALYIAKLCSDRGIPTTRIALGLPMGGHLEYADQLTVGRAMAERRSFLNR